VRLGVNRAEGSVEIRRDEKGLDRLRDGAEEGTETAGHTGCAGNASTFGFIRKLCCLTAM
jgi:hypothetical protein